MQVVTVILLNLTSFDRGQNTTFRFLWFVDGEEGVRSLLLSLDLRPYPGYTVRRTRPEEGWRSTVGSREGVQSQRRGRTGTTLHRDYT